jgi:hypothetical protein
VKKLPYLGTPVSDARFFGWRKSGVQQLRCRRRSDGPGAPPALGHSSGHRQSTRVRCRIVSLMRGLCLMAFANTSRALSRLLLTYSSRSIFAPPLVHFSTL